MHDVANSFKEMETIHQDCLEEEKRLFELVLANKEQKEKKLEKHVDFIRGFSKEQVLTDPDLLEYYYRLRKYSFASRERLNRYFKYPLHYPSLYLSSWVPSNSDLDLFDEIVLDMHTKPSREEYQRCSDLAYRIFEAQSVVAKRFGLNPSALLGVTVRGEKMY